MSNLWFSMLLLYHNFYSLDIANDFYSKLVEKEMHLYKIYPKERPRYLQLLCKALKSIKWDFLSQWDNTTKNQKTSEDDSDY